jgi:hypothetical protein
MSLDGERDLQHGHLTDEQMFLTLSTPSLLNSDAPSLAVYDIAKVHFFAKCNPEIKADC